MEPHHLLKMLLGQNRPRSADHRPPDTTDLHARGERIAALICCSELGGDPEALFHCSHDQLYTIQGAGVRLAPTVLDGVGYAVSLLRIRLIMVMAHTGCRLSRTTRGRVLPPIRKERRKRIHEAQAAWTTARRLTKELDLTRLSEGEPVVVAPLLLDSDRGEVEVVTTDPSSPHALLM